MKMLRKLFLGGLVAVLPLALTVYVVYWIGSTAEAFFGRVLKAVLSERHYVPGMGLVLGVVLIFAVGVLIHLWFVRRLLQWGNRLLTRIPLVKTLYGSMRDLMSYFHGSDEQPASHAAMVALGDGQARLLGVVTRSSLEGLPEGMGSEGDVAVFVPMSYQMGGFTIVVPRSRLTPVDLSFQDAMRLALTAYMAAAKPAPEDEPLLPQGGQPPSLAK